MSDLVKEALKLYFGDGFIAKLSSHWHVSQSQYEEIKRLNDMSESELRSLDLNKLSDAELSYLHFSDLLDKVIVTYANSHNPDYVYIWSNKSRNAFDMNSLRIFNFEKTGGKSMSVVISMPERDNGS